MRSVADHEPAVIMRQPRRKDSGRCRNRQHRGAEFLINSVADRLAPGEGQWEPGLGSGDIAALLQAMLPQERINREWGSVGGELKGKQGARRLRRRIGRSGAGAGELVPAVQPAHGPRDRLVDSRRRFGLARIGAPQRVQLVEPEVDLTRIGVRADR